MKEVGFNEYGSNEERSVVVSGQPQVGIMLEEIKLDEDRHKWKEKTVKESEEKEYADLPVWNPKAWSPTLLVSICYYTPANAISDLQAPSPRAVGPRVWCL